MSWTSGGQQIVPEFLTTLGHSHPISRGFWFFHSFRLPLVYLSVDPRGEFMSNHLSHTAHRVLGINWDHS